MSLNWHVTAIQKKKFLYSLPISRKGRFRQIHKQLKVQCAIFEDFEEETATSSGCIIGWASFTIPPPPELSQELQWPAHLDTLSTFFLFFSLFESARSHPDNESTTGARHLALCIFLYRYMRTVKRGQSVGRPNDFYCLTITPFNVFMGCILNFYQYKYKSRKMCHCDTLILQHLQQWIERDGWRKIEEDTMTKWTNASACNKYVRK